MARKQGGAIPKFGDWDNKNNKGGGGGSEYTMYFDSARNRKTGGGTSAYNPNFNPNDPSQNPEIFKQTPPQAKREERRGDQGYGSQQRDDRKYGSNPTAPPPKAGNRTPPHGYGQQRNERPDVILPAFGAWDETNPSSADNFTSTFEKAGRQTRRERGEYVPETTTYPSHYGTPNNGRKEKKHHCVIL